MDEVVGEGESISRFDGLNRMIDVSVPCSNVGGVLGGGSDVHNFSFAGMLQTKLAAGEWRWEDNDYGGKHSGNLFRTM